MLRAMWLSATGQVSASAFKLYFAAAAASSARPPRRMPTMAMLPS